MLEFMCFYFTPSSRRGITGSDASWRLMFIGSNTGHVILSPTSQFLYIFPLLLRCEVVCFCSFGFPNGCNDVGHPFLCADGNLYIFGKQSVQVLFKLSFIILLSCKSSSHRLASAM